MLRNRQHSRKDEGFRHASAGADLKIEVMCALVDDLDLHSFLHEPAYRRRVTEIFDCLTDEEFDRFERLYTRRFTIN